MGVKRPRLYLLVFLGFILIFVCPISLATTNAADVSAMNKLYAALGSPGLTGWTASAGDPCDERWQGVLCDTTNTKIISITVHGAISGGELGDTLGAFSSLQSIDLSDILIGGVIPTDLPVTLTNIDLSGNNLSGELPSSLRSLSSLTTLHLQNNKLSGTLDVLQDLPLLDL